MVDAFSTETPMTGGANAPPSPAPNGGEYLLSLLQKPTDHHHHQPQTVQPQPPLLPAQQPQQQPLAVDPAVAAVGPSIPFPPQLWQSNSQDLLHPFQWPVQSLAPRYHAPNGFLGFPHSFFPPGGNQFQGNQAPQAPPGNLGEDFRMLGFSAGMNSNSSSSSNSNSIRGLVQQKQQFEHKLKFGSFTSEIQGPVGLSNTDASLVTSNFNNGLDRNRQLSSNPNSNAFRHGNYDSLEQERRGGGGGGGLGKQHHGVTPPPGFPSKPRGGGSRDQGNRRGLNHNVDREKNVSGEFMSKRNEDARIRGDGNHGLGLSAQLDHPGPPSGTNIRLASASDIGESLINLESEAVEVGDRDRVRKEQAPVHDRGGHEMDDIGQRIVDSLLIEDESDDRSESKQHQHSREKVSFFPRLCSSFC